MSPKIKKRICKERKEYVNEKRICKERKHIKTY